MPPLNTILPIHLMHTLLPLRPTHPIRLRPTHNTNHLIRHRQFSINSRSKRMNQFRPVVIPQPQHSTAVRAEVPLRGAAFFLRRAAIFDSGVFPTGISISLMVWINVLRKLGLTWWGLCLWGSSGCRRCRPGSRCHCTRPPCDRCYKRRAGMVRGSVTVGWIQCHRIGSFRRVSCEVLVSVVDAGKGGCPGKAMRSRTYIGILMWFYVKKQLFECDLVHGFRVCLNSGMMKKQEKWSNLTRVSKDMTYILLPTNTAFASNHCPNSHKLNNRPDWRIIPNSAYLQPIPALKQARVLLPCRGIHHRRHPQRWLVDAVFDKFALFVFEAEILRRLHLALYDLVLDYLLNLPRIVLVRNTQDEFWSTRRWLSQLQAHTVSLTACRHLCECRSFAGHAVSWRGYLLTVLLTIWFDLEGLSAVAFPSTTMVRKSTLRDPIVSAMQLRSWREHS